MRQLCIMLLACLALAGNAWAYTYTWTGAVDSNWANPGNWICGDPNAPPGPPITINNWEEQYCHDRYDDPNGVPDCPVILSGNVVIGNGVTATGDYTDLAVAPGSGPLTVTIEAGGTFFPAIVRAGQSGSTLDVIQNGGLVKTVWVWNQPRTTASTCASTYTMNAGTALFAEFNLNTAGTRLHIAPGAVFKERGSGNYWDYDVESAYRRTLAQRIQKWTDYISAGKVTTATGYHLEIVTLVGQGYSEGGQTIDAIQILPVSEGPVNTAPVVSAGLDRTISLPAPITLDGTVTDDGNPNPPATLTYTWSMVAGPTAPTFGTPNAVDTTATFATNGTYVLRLTASDSELSTSDDVQIIVLKDLRADFNNDGFVDGLDFLRWQANFNKWPTGGATKDTGDANGDGTVDGLDFLIWQAGFNR